MQPGQNISPTDRSPLHLGLTGYPLGHSLSPLLHQAALAESGLAGEYRLFSVPSLPEGAPALQALLAQVREGIIHGLNVTIPHKQSVLEYLDELTPSANAIGAVNTIYTAGDRLVGDNTDAAGFIADLYSRLDKLPAARSAIVLGAGGSARAVVYALLNKGWQVAVAARRFAQARELVKGFQAGPTTPRPNATAHLQAIELNQFQLEAALSQLSPLESRNLLIINATPAGMAPHTGTCAWPEEVPFPAGAFVYDLVYNPSETYLVRLARSQSIPAASGLGMLVEQAALAFEIWTGHPAPRVAMTAVLSDQVDENMFNQ